MLEKRRVRLGRVGTWWSEAAVVACTLLVSAALLGVVHYDGDPAWLHQHLPAVAGSDAALWSVQTTFLSVGFAGLAIAAQLFADAPLAIGASRGRVLAYIGAGWFVTVGLVANAVMAIETIWLPSATGVVIAFAWFVATAVLLLVSTSRLTQLFGHPSRLDEVVRSSLVDTLSDRLDDMSRRYADATKGVGHLLAAEPSSRASENSASTLRVPVPEAGRVIKSIKLKPVRQAIASLAMPATDRGSADASAADRSAQEEYVSPRIMLDVHPGDRTRLGDTAFRVVTSGRLDAATAGRVVRLLQSSIELEPPGAVTPFEETEHEIAKLKDAIGTNLRSGALSTAERALELLGHVVRGVWLTAPDRSVVPLRRRSAWGSGLFESISEVEQDVLLSPQAAHVILNAATVRALEAPGTGSPEYVDECLRSFTRQWSDILQHGGPEFDPLPARIVTCVENLTVDSGPSANSPEGLRSRGVWAMAELVKLALDAKKPDVATVAAVQLQRLFELDREGSGRSEVRAAQLVLSGWLDYLAGTGDERSPADPGLRAALLPEGGWNDIFAARDVIQEGTPFSRWDRWGTEAASSVGDEPSALPGFIDRAQVAALTGSSGSLPAAEDQETASEYGRLLRLMPDIAPGAGPGEGDLKKSLEEELGKWDAAADVRLAAEPLSSSRVESLRTSLREALRERERLWERIPAGEDPAPAGEDPEEGRDEARPIVGITVRVARHSFVDGASDEAQADPDELGRMIASAVTDAEDRRVLARLRALQATVLGPTRPATRETVQGVRDVAQRYVLLTPYGGFQALRQGYPADVIAALDRVERIETGALDDEAILFDRRTTLRVWRRPEDRDGLSPVEGTAIALGVVDEDDGRGVRVEAGEHFLVLPGDAPRVVRFGAEGGVGAADAQRK